MAAGLRNPRDLLTAFLRLAGSLDDRLVVWWMSGRRYGVVDARATLLFGMQVGMFHRYFRVNDDRVASVMFELTYYTDPATGELLETFDNPYTGATTRVRHVQLGPEIRYVTGAGIERPDNPAVTAYHSALGPARVQNEDVWIPLDVEATIEFPPPGEWTIVLNHYTTVHGRLADAMNPDLLCAPCGLSFQNVLKWEPFLQMGDHPGHMMSRAVGRKLESCGDLPADYRGMAERLHAGLIADPQATLEPLAADVRRGGS